MQKLQYIDSLRGMAILAVLLVHTNQFGVSKLPAFIENIVGQGARGVQLFYIASAFTLFLSFKNRIGKEKFLIRNFFIRRFFRIAPMYYLGVCYYLFQDGFGPRHWLGDQQSISVWNILSNVTFLHAFNPYWITSIVPGGWSIGVEVIFYATIPFLYEKIKNISQAFIFFILTCFFRLFLFLILLKFPLITSEQLWREYLFLYFPSHLPIFSLGILMYFIIIKNDSDHLSKKWLLVFSLLLLAQQAVGIQFIFPNHILFGITFMLLGISLSRYSPFILVNPIINYIGKISFSMYLVHFAVLHWLSHFNLLTYSNNKVLNYVILYLIVSFFTIIISTLFYNLIEIPFQNLGRKIILQSETTSKK